MEYTQFPFESAYHSLQQEAQAYHGLPVFGDLDSTDGQVFGLDVTSHDALDQPVASWSHTSLQRYLTDTQRQPLCNPMHRPQIPSLAPPVAPFPPVPCQQRDRSPSSSQEPSHCGSALSPGADTELHTDHMPSTPPDLSMFPAFQPASIDAFEASQQLSLSGVGAFPGSIHSCVSMAEVSPADGIQNSWKASPAAIDFDSPQRGYTFDSESSAPSAAHDASRHSSLDQGYGPAMTPEATVAVKDEVDLPEQPFFIDNMMAPYPTPSARDSDNSDADIDAESIKTEGNDEDDDEYQPNKKRASASSSRSTRSKRHAQVKLEHSAKRARTALNVSQPARPLPPSTNASKPSLFCSECRLHFKDEVTLQSHVKKQHTRPFTCVFHFAGCKSTFASKNEWKRHVMSQHLVLHYWLCDLDVCAHNRNSVALPSKSSSPSSKPRKNRGKVPAAYSSSQRTLNLDSAAGPPLPNGAIFNRKDLYTQHIRRMHAPSTKASAGGKKSPSPSAAEWDDQVKALQTAAVRERCKLPTYMVCPTPRCGVAFSGADAWDQRMEHVARHLERAALGQEEPVVFGGEQTDPSLMAWVTSPEVSVVRPVAGHEGAWVLNNPLRAASEGRGVGRKRDVSTPAFLSGNVNTPSSSNSVGTFSAVDRSLDTHVKSEALCEEWDEDAEGEDE